MDPKADKTIFPIYEHPPTLKIAESIPDSNNSLHLYYCAGINNFGDELSPYLLRKITNRRIVPAGSDEDGKIVAVGSLLSYEVLHSKSIVWGTGSLANRPVNILPKPFPLKRSIRTLINRISAKKPYQAEVAAVRGPLTRNLLLQDGRACPEIYGDPALLLPRYYTPTSERSGHTGLIVHYSQEEQVHKFDLGSIGIKLISIQRSGDAEIEDFINELYSCGRIFSSSLHGIVVAQSYGIPAQWIQLRGRRIHSDENHKFNDYFLGAQLPVQRPLRIKCSLDDFKALSDFRVSAVEIRNSIGDSLLSALPV